MIVPVLAGVCSWLRRWPCTPLRANELVLRASDGYTVDLPVIF